MSPSYRKRRREKLLERSRKGVAARLRNMAERHAGDPVREWQLVRKLTDEALGRCRRVIEVWAMYAGDGKCKVRVTDNGHEVHFRSMGGVFRALARSA